jgi:hypothetical protein
MGKALRRVKTMPRSLLCDISVDKDDARFGGGDDRLWHSGIGTTYPKRLKRSVSRENPVAERTNMRCLRVSGRVREKIRIRLRDMRCPFSVGLEQCSSILVVSHSKRVTFLSVIIRSQKVRKRRLAWNGGSNNHHFGSARSQTTLRTVTERATSSSRSFTTFTTFYDPPRFATPPSLF